MPKSDKPTPRDLAFEKLQKQQRKEINHYLKTGERPTAPERSSSMKRGGAAKDAAE